MKLAARFARLSLIATFVLSSCAQERPPATPTPGVDWPGFRGIGARGHGGPLPVPREWDVDSGRNVRFRTEIPGLAHASPVVWGDRVYVATVVSLEGEVDFRHGLFGDGDAAEDRWRHSWRLLAVDKHDGRVIWDVEAHRGVPIDRRHVKATYANATPATDGRIVVALFGSEGLFAFDIDGNALWHADLGRLDAGAYDAPSYEWGSASSPIIDGDRVIVQCDSQGESFIAAYSTETGRELWRTGRDALPSWSTPTVVASGDVRELVTNGSPDIVAYDPATGTESWRLSGSSNITAPTPFEADGKIVVTSGRRPEKPIFVVRSGSGGKVVWSVQGRGSYMPTPIVHGGVLYTLNNNGILDAWRLDDGTEIYRQRIPHVGSGFSASPVLSDGHLFLAGEDGDVFVVRAGESFELSATLEVGERMMATPAISEGVLYVRGDRHLWAFGD